MFFIDFFKINFSSFLLEGLFDATGLILITTPFIYHLSVTSLYDTKDVGNSLLYMIVKYCSMVFIIEFGIMSFLGLFQFANPYYDNLLDTLLAVLIALPILYYWVMPLSNRRVHLLPPSKRKIFVGLYLPCLIFISALSYSIYHTKVINKTVRLESNERAQLEMINTHIILQLQSVFADLAFLANQTELLEMLAVKEGAKTVLLRDYASFLKSKRYFDRIRFIDAQGMEVVRVEYNSGQPIASTESYLQSKAKRYYFKETMALSSGEIFVSPLDLNMENGVVERPVKPMIRFGIPVYDSQQQKRGMLILNLYGQLILDHLRQLSANLPGDLFLLNERGDYLFSTVDQDVWSFMFPDKPQNRFQDQFSQAWSRIEQEDHGQFRNGAGRFTFVTPQKSKNMAQYRESLRNGSINWSNWKVVSVFSEEQERAVFGELWYGMLVLNVVLALLVLIACGWVAKVMSLEFHNSDERYWNQVRQEMLLLLNEVDDLNLSEIATYAIDDALVLTGSKEGFIAILDEDGGLSVLADTSQSVELGNMPGTSLFDKLPNDTLMAVVSSQEVRMINAYQLSFPEDGGTATEKGFMVIARVMLLPLLENERVVGIVGVANKPYDYEPSDKRQLKLFLEGMMIVLARRDAQREISAAKKAADVANQAKRDFLRNVGHELRTPLNTISGMNYMLEQSSLSAKQKQYIRNNKEASTELLAIINNILDYAKVCKGGLKVSSSDSFNLNTLVKTVVDQIKSKIGTMQKNIIVETAINQEISPQLIGDPFRLRQVLQHLAENAVKFSEAGKIVIAVEAIKKKGLHAWLRFSVKDSGIGLSPEHIASLFRSFSQVDASRSRKFAGIGLGLSVSKQLVQLMGGELSVESELGKGSTFTFWLKLGRDEKVPWASVATMKANSTVAQNSKQEMPQGIIAQSLWPKLHDLVALCAINDLAAYHLFSEISGEMEDIFPDQTKKIFEKIEVYDFEGAASLISGILTT